MLVLLMIDTRLMSKLLSQRQRLVWFYVNQWKYEYENIFPSQLKTIIVLLKEVSVHDEQFEQVLTHSTPCSLLNVKS